MYVINIYKFILKLNAHLLNSSLPISTQWQADNGVRACSSIINEHKKKKTKKI